jgi:hypothetical protein
LPSRLLLYRELLFPLDDLDPDCGLAFGRAFGVGVDGRLTEQTPSESVADDEEDDGLGGYGFFDAGMLRQALNANRAQVEPVERDVIRRNIGRRLRLAEY